MAETGTGVGTDALGLLTVREAAALMRLGKRTVDRMIHDDEIESVKIGRARRIRRQAVANYIASLPTGGGSPDSADAHGSAA